MTQRRDFFTQKQLLSDWVPPVDWFNHKPLAEIFHQRASQLAPGSVVAIQGGWGTGKTDLLARIFIEEKNRRLGEFGGDEEKAQQYFPIWINPWRQSVPDVISPIASILVERLGLEKGERKKLMNTIVSAGFSLVQKGGAVALTLSGNPIAGAALAGMPNLPASYQKTDGDDSLVWRDPVTELADSFRELVERIIPRDESKHGNRLIICIDDLDRCPPMAQVQILESIVFLAAAGAPVSIYAGLDPNIVSASIENRYRVDNFGAEQYLAKIFSTRFNLPERTGSEIERALNGIMKEEFPTSAGTDSLEDIIQTNLGVPAKFFVEAGARIFFDAQLGRARLIRKVMNDLFLFASSKPKLKLRDETHVLTFFVWLTICNQFPADRKKLLSADRTSEATRIFIDRIFVVTGDEGKKSHFENFYCDARSLDPYLQLAGI